MTTLTKEERIFLGDLTSICYENRINLILKNKKSINKCSGSFDGETLNIALNSSNGDHPTIMGIIVHESCHVDQHLEGINIWNDSIFNSGDMWTLYSQNKIGKTKRLKKYFKTLLEIELDCEKRAVKKIIKYNLPLNISNYIKMANVYLYSYRKFYEENFSLCDYNKMSSREDILNLVPDKYFDNVSEYWNIKTNILYKNFKVC